MTDLVPLVPVTASLKDPVTGLAAGSGAVTFEMSHAVVDSAGDELGPKTRTVTVTNGEFATTTKLPATDTSTNNPTSFTYKITVATDMWQQVFNVALPFSAGASRTLGNLWKTSPDNV